MWSAHPLWFYLMADSPGEIHRSGHADMRGGEPFQLLFRVAFTILSNLPTKSMISLVVPHNLIQVVAVKKFDRILLDLDPKQ